MTVKETMKLTFFDVAKWRRGTTLVQREMCRVSTALRCRQTVGGNDRATAAMFKRSSSHRRPAATTGVNTCHALCVRHWLQWCHLVHLPGNDSRLSQIYNKTTTTPVLWPLQRTTRVSRHPQLRIGEFCWSKVLLPACPCWRLLAHSDYREDARVLLKRGTCTISVPSRTILIGMQNVHISCAIISKCYSWAVSDNDERRWLNKLVLTHFAELLCADIIVLHHAVNKLDTYTNSI